VSSSSVDATTVDKCKQRRVQCQRFLFHARWGAWTCESSKNSQQKRLLATELAHPASRPPLGALGRVYAPRFEVIPFFCIAIEIFRDFRETARPASADQVAKKIKIKMDLFQK